MKHNTMDPNDLKIKEEPIESREEYELDQTVKQEVEAVCLGIYMKTEDNNFENEKLKNHSLQNLNRTVANNLQPDASKVLIPSSSHISNSHYAEPVLHGNLLLSNQTSTTQNQVILNSSSRRLASLRLVDQGNGNIGLVVVNPDGTSLGPNLVAKQPVSNTHNGLSAVNPIRLTLNPKVIVEQAIPTLTVSSTGLFAMHPTGTTMNQKIMAKQARSTSTASSSGHFAKHPTGTTMNQQIRAEQARSTSTVNSSGLFAIHPTGTTMNQKIMAKQARSTSTASSSGLFAKHPTGTTMNQQIRAEQARSTSTVNSSGLFAIHPTGTTMNQKIIAEQARSTSSASSSGHFAVHYPNSAVPVGALISNRRLVNPEFAPSVDLQAMPSSSTSGIVLSLVNPSEQTTNSNVIIKQAVQTLTASSIGLSAIHPKGTIINPRIMVRSATPTLTESRTRLSVIAPKGPTIKPKVNTTSVASNSETQGTLSPCVHNTAPEKEIISPFQNTKTSLQNLKNSCQNMDSGKLLTLRENTKKRVKYKILNTNQIAGTPQYSEQNLSNVLMPISSTNEPTEINLRNETMGVNQENVMALNTNLDSVDRTAYEGTNLPLEHNIKTETDEPQNVTDQSKKIDSGVGCSINNLPAQKFIKEEHHQECDKINGNVITILPLPSSKCCQKSLTQESIPSTQLGSSNKNQDKDFSIAKEMMFLPNKASINNERVEFSDDGNFMENPSFSIVLNEDYIENATNAEIESSIEKETRMEYKTSISPSEVLKMTRCRVNLECIDQSTQNLLKHGSCDISKVNLLSRKRSNDTHLPYIPVKKVTLSRNTLNNAEPSTKYATLAIETSNRSQTLANPVLLSKGTPNDTQLLANHATLSRNIPIGTQTLLNPAKLSRETPNNAQSSRQNMNDIPTAANEFFKNSTKPPQQGNKENNGPYGCGLCDQTFQEMCNLECHLRLIHKSSNKELRRKTYVAPQTEKKDDMDTWEMVSLNQFITLQNQFNGNQVQKSSCDKEEENTENELEQSSWIHGCALCDKKCKDMDSLLLHMKSHRTGRYKCMFCPPTGYPYCFERKHQLHKHIDEYHSQEKVKVISQRQNYLNLGEDMLNNPSYKVTKQVLQMNDIILLETKTGRFRCCFCDKSFWFVKFLQAHILLDHTKNCRNINTDGYYVRAFEDLTLSLKMNFADNFIEDVDSLVIKSRWVNDLENWNKGEDRSYNNFAVEIEGIDGKNEREIIEIAFGTQFWHCLECKSVCLLQSNIMEKSEKRNITEMLKKHWQQKHRNHVLSIYPMLPEGDTLQGNSIVKSTDSDIASSKSGNENSEEKKNLNSTVNLDEKRDLNSTVNLDEKRDLNSIVNLDEKRDLNSAVNRDYNSEMNVEEKRDSNSEVNLLKELDCHPIISKMDLTEIEKQKMKLEIVRVIDYIEGQEEINKEKRKTENFSIKLLKIGMENLNKKNQKRNKKTKIQNENMESDFLCTNQKIVERENELAENKAERSFEEGNEKRRKVKPIKKIEPDILYVDPNSKDYKKDNGLIENKAKKNLEGKRKERIGKQNKSKKMKYFCEICDTECTNLTLHKRIYHDRYKKVPRKPQKKHIYRKSTYIRSKVKNIECQICGGKVVSRFGLLKHLQNSHSDRIIGNIKPHLKNVHCVKIGKKRVCSMCGEVLWSLEDYVEHAINNHYDMRPHENITQDTDDIRPQETNVVQNMKYILCEVCGKFIAPSSFYPHFRNHKGSFCDHCGKFFTTKQSFLFHVRNQKNKLKGPFTCKKCDKILTDHYSFQRHVKRCGESNTFKCEDCGKEFPLKIGLKYHINCKHLNMKRFACDVCSFKSFYADALKYHMKINHKVKIAAPYTKYKIKN